MKRPKHAAHAIGELRRMHAAAASGLIKVSEQNLATAIGDLDAAAKFLLPDDGRLLHGDPERVAHWLSENTRLPFPIIALEFDAPTALRGEDLGDALDAMVVLARQDIDQQEITILSVIRYRRGRVAWVPADEVVYDPKTGDFASALPPTMTSDEAEAYLRKSRRAGNLKEPDSQGVLTRAATTALGEFLAALACSNVRIQTVAGTERRHWAESRRERELPHYTYSELVIETPRTKATGAPGDGHHASPRQHLRRGHIRRYASGQTIWINAMVVGDASRGVVDKHYRMKEGSR